VESFFDWAKGGEQGAGSLGLITEIRGLNRLGTCGMWTTKLSTSGWIALGIEAKILFARYE